MIQWDLDPASQFVDIAGHIKIVPASQLAESGKTERTLQMPV